MYEFDFVAADTYRTEPTLSADGIGPCPFDARTVRRVVSLRWEEHCVECADPDCFATCTLYDPRADGNCRRLRYGIAPTPVAPGLYDVGADLRFRRWGKLEAAFEAAQVYVPPFGVAAPATHLTSTDPAEITQLLADTDELVIACYSPEAAPFRLIAEHFVMTRAGRRARFREAFELVPGWNVQRVPVQRLDLDVAAGNGYLLLHPEEPDRRVVFAWLDFVAYARAAADDAADGATGDAKTATPHAPKVKCVAWDLDNTLWSGVLVEGADVAAALRPEIRAVIDALDARGILQTVVSKNDHDQAWAQLLALGLAPYFVYPAINWDPKSANLRAIAESLNLGLDAFALVDDSPFERAEVAAALPMVRVYGDDAIASLLGDPAFDVPVTPEGRKRRAMYQTDMERRRIQADFAATGRGDFEAFLASCQMQMRLFRLHADSPPRELTRAWELIQRSNQLNLSGRRHDRAAFDALIATPGYLALGFACRDQFGDYGIVGFACLDERPERGREPLLADLVVSCRVAQKRVEHALIGWLATRSLARGSLALAADLQLTGRNMPITQILRDLGFGIAKADGNRLLMRLRLTGLQLALQPVELTADAID